MRAFWAWSLVLLSAMQVRADDWQAPPLATDQSESVSAGPISSAGPMAEAVSTPPAAMVEQGLQPAGLLQPQGGAGKRASFSRRDGIFFRPWDRESAYVQDPNTEPERWARTEQIMNECEGCPVTPPHVGADFFNTHCRRGGLVGGVELVFLKPFQGFNAPTSTLPVVNPQTAAFNYGASQRYWLGYVCDDGLGIRVRYFDYDRGADRATATFQNQTQTLNGAVRSRQLDLEMTQQVAFRSWSLLVFGGLRYGELLQATSVREADSTANTFVGTQNSFHGLGLTGGLQGQRAVGWFPNLSLYFFGRGSLLYGNQRLNATAFDAANPPASTVAILGHNDNMMIWEIGMGPQWQKPLSGGGSLFVRGGVEAQLYQPSGGGTIDSGNMGLTGFSFSLGLNR